MYMKDLKHKMTLRLNDELLEYINEMSNQFSISPSDFIRQCVAQHKDARQRTLELVQKMAETASTQLDLRKEGFENGTDRKTDKYSKL